MATALEEGEGEKLPFHHEEFFMSLSSFQGTRVSPCFIPLKMPSLGA